MSWIVCLCVYVCVCRRNVLSLLIRRLVFSFRFISKRFFCSLCLAFRQCQQPPSNALSDDTVKNSDWSLQIDAEMLLFIVLIIIIRNDLSLFYVNYYFHFNGFPFSSSVFISLFISFFRLQRVYFTWEWVHILSNWAISLEYLENLFANTSKCQGRHKRKKEGTEKIKENEQSQANKRTYISIKRSLKHETNHLFTQFRLLICTQWLGLGEQTLLI